MAPGLTSAAPAPGNLVAFPRGDLRRYLGSALKRHRLPEDLAQALVRDCAKFSDAGADTALAKALARRLVAAPVDLENARGILLVGPGGSGKSAVAAKIARSAGLIGRKTELVRADGLALFRARSVRESGSDTKTKSVRESGSDTKTKSVRESGSDIKTKSVRESGSDSKTKSVRESGSDNKSISNPPELLTVMEADGFNPLNPRAACAFSALGDIDGVVTIGVVSALNDAEDVGDIVTRFRFRRVIVTGLDLTRRLGAVLAASLSGARLAHVTYGPRPEDGLELLEPGALAAQLLE
jgi:flagellar biosynthesis protein FlhF